MEAFHRILEDECLAGQEFETFTEAYRTVAKFTEFYNKRRIHSGIHYMAPEEF
ncbi:MAG TPA: transposase [Firmicutes bacterium]|nr:transposase [Bacillota bacterium]